MKIRSSHIIIVGGTAVFAFILFAVMRERSQESDTSALSTPQSQGPRIFIANRTIDMGTISNRQPTDITTEISNQGSAVLEIGPIQGSCPCIKATLDMQAIPPGQSAKLTITMDPFHISGFECYEKSISFNTNDPSLPIVIIQVPCKITPEFTLEPQALAFGEINKGDNLEQTILVRQADTLPLEMKGVELSSQGIKGVELSYAARPKETWSAPDKAEYLITAKLTPEVRPGDLFAGIRILTNIERLKSGVMTSLTGKVNTFYRVSPGYVIRLQQIEPGQQDAGVITIESDEPVSLSDAVSTASNVSVRILAQEDPKKASIALDIKPDAQRGPIRGEVTFSVHGPDKAVPDFLVLQGYVGAVGAMPVPAQPAPALTPKEDAPEANVPGTAGEFRS